jgi:hypothetical protein
MQLDYEVVLVSDGVTGPGRNAASEHVEKYASFFLATSGPTDDFIRD